MFGVTESLVLAAVMGSGILSGLFFVFSNFAMRAFKTLDPTAGIAAMQQINIKIINPLFMLVFMGTPALCAYIVFVAWSGNTGQASYWLATGALVHIFGSLVITIVGNVPLNNRLEAVDATTEAGKIMWREYHLKWVPLNHIRTVATILSTGLLAAGLALLV